MPSKTHAPLPGSTRARDADAVRVGTPDPGERIDVTIGLAGPALPAAHEHVGETWTPEQLRRRCGASRRDADTVAKCLERFGLSVDRMSLATRSMKVRGTIAAMEAAFKPRLARMRSPEQGEYRGRQGTLHIPAEIEGLVTGVFGLDERRMARRKSARTAAASSAPVSPADIERRYNFPPGDGRGQTIAIAEFGGGYFADDLAAYCRKFRRRVPRVDVVGVDAPGYTRQQIQALPSKKRASELDTSTEVMMDVEIIAALCPGARIAVYFSPFDQGGWIDLLDRVIDARPVALSVSWGLAEDDESWSKAARTAVDDRLNAARLLGITTCVSSGDDGSCAQMEDGRVHTNFPCTSPHALAVGGTMLTGNEEVGWWQKPGKRTSHGGGATGGGVSAVFPRPAWQKTPIVTLNKRGIRGRVVPDVSALSGPPFYDLIFSGKRKVNGGTSAAAPVWAALIARINEHLPKAKRQRFLTPLLYQFAHAAMRDITSGNNASHPHPGKGYQAGPGFDAVTGWGVPDGVRLLRALSLRRQNSESGHRRSSA